MYMIIKNILHLIKLPKFTENIKWVIGTRAQGSWPQSNGLPITRHYYCTLFPDKCVRLFHERKRVGLWNSRCDEEIYRDQNDKKELTMKMWRPQNKSTVAQMGSSHLPPTTPGKNLPYWNPDSSRACKRHVGFLIPVLLLF